MRSQLGDFLQLVSLIIYWLMLLLVLRWLCNHVFPPSEVPNTSVGHASILAVRPFMKIWWRNKTVSELRKMELRSSWEQGGFFDDAAILNGLRKHETNTSNCSTYSSSASTIRNTKLTTEFHNLSRDHWWIFWKNLFPFPLKVSLLTLAGIVKEKCCKFYKSFPKFPKYFSSSHQGGGGSQFERISTSARDSLIFKSHPLTSSSSSYCPREETWCIVQQSASSDDWQKLPNFVKF